MPAYTAHVITAAIAAAALAPSGASGSFEPEAMVAGATAGAVLDALHEECYEVGMSVAAAGPSIIVCSAALSGGERLDGAPLVSIHQGHVRHRIRFAVAERNEGVRVWAFAWIEMEESDGRLLEQDLRSESYLARVQAVLDGLETRLEERAEGDAGWAARYDSAEAWRLDAHLRAVAHCDESLDALTPRLIDRQLADAGLTARGRTVRDRCEELYEAVFAWGLARGLEKPTPEEYTRQRAAAPQRERACAGRLALAASCP